MLGRSGGEGGEVLGKLAGKWLQDGVAELLR